MNKEKQAVIFIDAEDMEERYAEGLYMDYLKQENEQLKDRINKAIDFTEKQKKKMYKSRNKIAMFVLMKLEEILKEND